MTVNTLTEFFSNRIGQRIIEALETIATRLTDINERLTEINETLTPIEHVRSDDSDYDDPEATDE